MALTNKQAAAICGSLGHQPEGILSKTEHKHVFICGCGYLSTNRRNVRLAVEAGIHHMRKVASDAVANGFKIPDEDTLEEETPRGRVAV